MGNILHLLTAVLVVLKLLGTIQVSWWLAVAPSLIGLALGLVFLIIAGGIVGLAAWLGR